MECEGYPADLLDICRKLKHYDYDPDEQIKFIEFLEKLDAAEKANGEQGFVTPETLRTQLNTQAWLGLENPESGIYKLLVSDLFKDPKKKQEGNQIDSEILRIAGVIHC